MPQPKSSPAEVSMPTFATLEEWTRLQVQELMQSVLEEEVTHVLGGGGDFGKPGGSARASCRPRTEANGFRATAWRVTRASKKYRSAASARFRVGSDPGRSSMKRPDLTRVIYPHGEWSRKTPPNHTSLWK